MKAGERQSGRTSARRRIPVTDGCRITKCFFLFLDVKHSRACMCKFLLGQIYCCEKKTEFPEERSFIGQSHAVCQRFHWWTQTEGMKKRDALRPEVKSLKDPAATELVQKMSKWRLEHRRTACRKTEWRAGFESIRTGVIMLGFLVSEWRY